MADLGQEEDETMMKEIPKLQQSINEQQNEQIIIESRLKNVKQEKYQNDRSKNEYLKMTENVMSLENIIKWKDACENEEMQQFEVRLYNQTII